MASLIYRIVYCMTLAGELGLLWAMRHPLPNPEDRDDPRDDALTELKSMTEDGLI